MILNPKKQFDCIINTFHRINKAISASKLLQKYFNQNLARTISILIVLTIVIVHLNLRLWNESDKVIVSDVLSYYTYLPAVFVYHDLTLEYVPANIDKLRGKIWFAYGPEGYRTIQTTYGLSLLFSPFFLAAHATAPVIGYESNGYTSPYKFFLVLSSIFYFAVGLYFLRKTLSIYFNQVVTALTMILIVFGTNLLHYLLAEATMSHAYSFSLISVFIYLTIKWHNRITILRSIGIGILAGLIVLIRPSNILVVLIFIFWGIYNLRTLKSKVLLLLNKPTYLLLIIAGAFIIWIPQFLYWKLVSGNFIYFSYGENAHFFFNDPEISNILFSYRKGWFLYTPVMIFPLLGIPFLYQKVRGAILPVSLFLIVNTYILASWCFWWFGGSYGARAFIDSYAILAIPLAALLGWLLQKPKPLKLIIVFLFIALFISHNLFQIRKYKYGAIHYVAMTKEAYWETFLKLKPTAEFYEYLEFPDYDAVYNRIEDIKRKD